MKEIQLTQGFVTIVDDEDYEWLNAFPWHYLLGYARKNVIGPDRKQHPEFMHRWILGLEWGDPRPGDHINHDSLDNRRSNLRICSDMKDNATNVSARVGCSSRFKGVSWHKAGNRWRAYISFDGKHQHIGSYVTEEEAARAYDRAAIEHYGEFVCTNVSLGLLPPLET